MKGNKNFSKSEAFTHEGFFYWNKPARFRMHQNSEEHMWANLKVVEIANSTPVDELFDKQSESIKETNRKCFFKVLENIKFLCVRNIALRGHEEHGLDDSSNSNLFELTKLRALDDQDLQAWTEKKRGKYMDHHCQNEVLHLMGSRLLHEHILRPIQKGCTLSKCF